MDKVQKYNSFSLVSFVAITLYVASQRVIPKVSIYFDISLSTQSGNFWLHPCMSGFIASCLWSPGRVGTEFKFCDSL
jgi:hypothetical protein